MREFFKWEVTRKIFNVAALCKKHGFMGSVIGEPGLGKSTALKLYTAEDTMAVPVELFKPLGGGTPSGITRRIMAMCDTRSYDAKTQTRGEWIVKHFEGTGRLLIIDNAHELTQAGLEWVLGFHDSTRCPVLLIGNVELERTIHLVRRAPSRIGVHRDLRAKDELEKAAADLLRIHWPEAPELMPHIKRLIMEPGMLRTVRHALRTARGIAQHKGKPPVEALEAARAMQPQFTKPGRRAA